MKVEMSILPSPMDIIVELLRGQVDRKTKENNLECQEKKFLLVVVSIEYEKRVILCGKTCLMSLQQVHLQRYKSITTKII